MNTLNEKDSKKLFRRKAFGSAGNPCPHDEGLKDKMRSVLKKCGGIPLAIVSIGSLLARYKPPEGKEMWSIVQRSIGSQMEMNPTLEGMRQILTISYNHLPHHLKECMMYLSIFPEDYMISKDRLLKRWIAEGLVAEKRGLTQMELAEGYFDELISRSMIDRATDFVGSIWTSRRREERCKVHDLMLEIMVSTSLEANSVSLIGGQYEGMSYTNTVRRLSIHGRVEAALKDSSSSNKNVAAHYGTGNGVDGMMVEHVRSLSIFDPEVNNMLLARLVGEFTLLRVLDLEGCKGLVKKAMSYICQMYLLRFLGLRGTDVKVMPQRVGDLEHLQTLDVRETDLKDLPDTITKLEKLEHLLFSDKGASCYDLEYCSGWMMPHGINKMKRLRQVNRAEIDDPKAAEEIGELDQLQELSIYVDTRKEMNPEVLKELACSLSKMYSLRWLDIGNFGCGKWPFKQIMNFLHEVKSPPRLLQYLKIRGCINRLPDWVGSLTNLAEFDIAWTYIDSVGLFSVLYKLPNLKRLFLGAYFIRKGQNMVARSIQPFPKLKELIIGYSPDVPKVYRFEEGSMPELKTLVANFGDQPKKIVGIEHLTNLKEVQYSGSEGNGEMKDAVEQLEELNKKRGLFKKITVRARYEDGW
jgi:disease resistance protein RPM1